MSLVLGLLVLLSPGQTARADEARSAHDLSGSDLLVTLPDGSSSKVPLGCAGVGKLEHGGRLYVACGADGVVILSLSDPATPTVAGRRQVDGSAVGFFVQDGGVWIKISRLEARPLSSARAAVPPVSRDEPDEPGRKPDPAPAAPAATVPKAKPAAVGKVVGLGVDNVMIDLGSDAGLKREQKVELFSREQVEMGGEEATRERILAVGKVLAVSSGRARVRLGMNEDVPLGTGARRSKRKTTESIIAPPRVGGQFEAKLHLRPFLPLEESGFGMLVDASLTYRFSFPMVLRMIFEPTGFAATGDETMPAVTGHVVLGLDMKYFEIGLGIGGSIVSDEVDIGGAFTTTQVARFGALDGLHVEIHNALQVYNDAIHYGSTTATIQFPFSARWWGQLRGGGGFTGWFLGEAGLRVLLRGNGRKGSVFLTATLGWCMVDGKVDNTKDGYPSYASTRSVDYGGPMVGIGVEWRP